MEIWSVPIAIIIRSFDRYDSPQKPPEQKLSALRTVVQPGFLMAEAGAFCCLRLLLLPLALA